MTIEGSWIPVVSPVRSIEVGYLMRRCRGDEVTGRAATRVVKSVRNAVARSIAW